MCRIECKLTYELYLHVLSMRFSQFDWYSKAVLQDSEACDKLPIDLELLWFQRRGVALLLKRKRE